MVDAVTHSQRRMLETFDVGGLTALRHAVTTCAADCGLVGVDLENFIVGVNEIAMNAVHHGGGRGTLELWVTDADVTCVIIDDGRGIPADVLDGDRLLPPPSTLAGRGLRVARLLCDDMVIATGATGTTVRLTMAVPPPLHR
jgi:anti-sigma regulatory factor (Ser/Thr protein kinase)